MTNDELTPDNATFEERKKAFEELQKAGVTIFYRGQHPSMKFLADAVGKSGHTIDPYVTNIEDCYLRQHPLYKQHRIRNKYYEVEHDATLTALFEAGVVIEHEHDPDLVTFIGYGVGVCCALTLEEALYYAYGQGRIIVFTGEYTNDVITDGEIVKPDFSKPVVHFTMEEVQQFRS